MDDLKYNKVLSAIFIAAQGDPSIMTGLPAVDLSNPQLAFTRAIEICEKVETLISLDRQHHYQWYENLGLENPLIELKKYWAERQFRI